MSCLYNAMKAGGLRDVDEARMRITQKLHQQLEQGMQKDIRTIINEDPTFDQTAMGSANFLQMYLDLHPDLAFILDYKNPMTKQQTEWIMTGSGRPEHVIRISHTGSVDGGHFTHRQTEPYDFQHVMQVWRARRP